MLLPRDPNDGKAVIVEIRGAEGGEEANLFARDLYEMYSGYAAQEGWDVDVLSSDVSDLGGYNQITFMIKGDTAWGRLKFEGGTHRVQRVPVTESQGRIHTSSATVLILAEAEEVEIDIDEKDLQIDVYRASGPGGQGVNTTDSAVRITHLPTGIVVACQAERSQHKNRATAWKMLKARLYERELQMQQEKIDAVNAKKTDIGWGHQIRSYVLQPYQLIKDLRTGYTSTNPAAVLDGGLDDFIQASLAKRVQGLDSEVIEDID